MSWAKKDLSVLCNIEASNVLSSAMVDAISFCRDTILVFVLRPCAVIITIVTKLLYVSGLRLRLGSSSYFPWWIKRTVTDTSRVSLRLRASSTMDCRHPHDLGLHDGSKYNHTFCNLIGVIYVWRNREEKLADEVKIKNHQRKRQTGESRGNMHWRQNKAVLHMRNS